jgi:hypothetical protein
MLLLQEPPRRRDHRFDGALVSSKFSNERTNEDLGTEQALARVLVGFRGL